TVAATRIHVISCSANGPPAASTTITTAARALSPTGIQRLIFDGMPGLARSEVTAGTITPDAISASAVPTSAGRPNSSVSISLLHLLRPRRVRGHERRRDVERRLPPQKSLLRPVVPLPMPVPLLAPPRLALRPHAPVVGELTAKLLHLRRIRRPIAIMLLTIQTPLLGQVLDLPLHVDHVSLAGLDPLLASSPSPLRHPRPDRAEDLRYRLRDH